MAGGIIRAKDRFGGGTSPNFPRGFTDPPVCKLLNVNPYLVFLFCEIQIVVTEPSVAAIFAYYRVSSFFSIITIIYGLFVLQNYGSLNFSKVTNFVGDDWDIYVMTGLALLLAILLLLRRRQ